MGILAFTPDFEDGPDITGMSLEQLKVYQAELLKQLEVLDAREPKNMNSEAYEVWGDAHEELEDMLDEIQDMLEQME